MLYCRSWSSTKRYVKSLQILRFSSGFELQPSPLSALYVRMRPSVSFFTSNLQDSPGNESRNTLVSFPSKKEKNLSDVDAENKCKVNFIVGEPYFSISVLNTENLSSITEKKVLKNVFQYLAIKISND